MTDREKCECGLRAQCDGTCYILGYESDPPDANFCATVEVPCGFDKGNLVRKTRGYPWPGVVQSVFTTEAGETRVVVECTVPEVRGALHIFNPEQLERIEP